MYRGILMEAQGYRGECPLTSSSVLNFSMWILSNISSTFCLIMASPSQDLRETSRRDTAKVGFWSASVSHLHQYLLTRRSKPAE